MIQVKNISFNYTPDTRILGNVSFELEKGTTLAIVGASGCGKSTLLRIISGILPNSKQNLLEGSVFNENQTPDKYRKTGKLALMFQESTLMPNLSVKENIELPLKIKDIHDPVKVEALVKAVGLGDYMNYLPKHLSGGMKTRVALARSFVTNPELLLLDEPFSALDIAWKSKLYTELEKLRDEYGTTVIMVTHDVQEALLLANDVIVLNSKGEIETTKKLDERYTVKSRLNDISGYMSSIYESHMLPIQDAIINGQSKKNEKLDSVHTA